MRTELAYVTGQPAQALAPFSRHTPSTPWYQPLTDAEWLGSIQHAAQTISGRLPGAWLQPQAAQMRDIVTDVTVDDLRDDPRRRDHLMLGSLVLLHEYYHDTDFGFDPHSGRLCRIRQDNPHGRWRDVHYPPASPYAGALVLKPGRAALEEAVLDPETCSSLVRTDLHPDRTLASAAKAGDIDWDLTAIPYAFIHDGTWLDDEPDWTPWPGMDPRSHAAWFFDLGQSRAAFAQAWPHRARQLPDATTVTVVGITP